MRRWLVPLVLVGLLACPAAALANAYTQVQAAYAQSGSGQISACQFTSTELEAALRQAPSYSYQYQSDFTDAIEAALAARASGDCLAPGSGSGSGAAAGTAPSERSLGPGAHLTSASTRLPSSVTAAGSGGLPLVLGVAFGLIGALLLFLAGWLGLNALGHEPRGFEAARHSVREAEYRIAAGWEDLTDRLRR